VLATPLGFRLPQRQKIVNKAASHQAVPISHILLQNMCATFAADVVWI